MENYILMDISSSSSSSSDDDEEILNIIFNNVNRRKITKITNYITSVVERYTNIEFKSHFRFVISFNIL